MQPTLYKLSSVKADSLREEWEKNEEEVKSLSSLEAKEKERQVLVRQTYQLPQLMSEALELHLGLIKAEQEKMITELKWEYHESTNDSAQKVEAELVSSFLFPGTLSPFEVFTSAQSGTWYVNDSPLV